MHAVKKLLIEKKTGRVIDEKKLRARMRWRLIIALIVIGIIRTIPDPHIERWFDMEYTWWLDQLLHLAFYFVAMMTVFWLLPAERPTRTFFFSIFSITLLFELVQLLIPDRGFTILDIVSNFTGLAMAFLVRHWWLEMRDKRG